MKDHLDWIEVRGILRQIAQACADCLDGVFDAKDFVGGKVVHHHNVSALERRSQTLLEVGQKDFAVHCSVDQHRRDYSGETQARNEGHGLPVAQWHISDQALSARTAAIRSHHVGADRGLVDEHQSGRVKKPLLTNPASTCPSDVGALLNRGESPAGWLGPGRLARSPALHPSNRRPRADLKLSGGLTPRRSRLHKSNDSHSHLTGIRSAHGPPPGESMRIESVPGRPLGIPDSPRPENPLPRSSAAPTSRPDTASEAETKPDRTFPPPFTAATMYRCPFDGSIAADASSTAIAG